MAKCAILHGKPFIVVPPHEVAAFVTHALEFLVKQGSEAHLILIEE